jgi:hypothetical protein
MTKEYYTEDHWVCRLCPSSRTEPVIETSCSEGTQQSMCLLPLIPKTETDQVSDTLLSGYLEFRVMDGVYIPRDSLGVTFLTNDSKTKDPKLEKQS